MEHPILFSVEMVRAIMEGRKTQTRRVIKPQPNDIRESPFVKSGIEDTHGYEIKRKYAPGDKLWVRETWMPFTENGVRSGMAIYRATDKPEQDGDRPLKWRPSIFMPRWASRITLEVVSVRVERVQDISEEDALSEGISFWKPKEMDNRPFEENFWTNYPQFAFQNLWDSINAKRGYSCDANPWVWVIEFRRVE